MICKKLKIFIKLFCVFNVCFTWKSVQGSYLEENYPQSVIEDAALDTAQLIHKYQYPVESHYVTTEDNYIIQLHRIPKPKAPPVFLMHGIEDSSSAWILMGPDKAPGYYLYDNGFDVWLGNARGNRYSRNHTTLNPDTDVEFWNFSFHEIGFYDLPAVIDYVLAQTAFTKLAYIGHSQGTTSFWVLCSMHPQYNDKVTIMQALAPVAFMQHVKSPVLQLGRYIAEPFKHLIHEVLPRTDSLYKICFTSKTAADTCVGLLNQIVGPEDVQTNVTMYPAIFGHLPSGSSFKQFNHYRQLIISKRFCQYDYGDIEITKRFGKSMPPDYPLKKVTVPVGLHYTSYDYILNELDVKRLAKHLPNVVEDHLYPYKGWNHLAVMWGIDARKLVHKKLLEFMNKYSYV